MLEKSLQNELDKLQKRGLERRLPRLYEYNEGIIDFTSNDYLGLRRDGRVVEAMRSANSVGEGASRLVSRFAIDHLLLEEELAEFVGYPRALLYGVGYLGNLGVISALVSRKDLVISDRAVHASLIDGIRLSEARHLRFRHNDINHLENLLLENKDKRTFVVIESVYSMDGDIAPLSQICELKNKYSFELVVDEAHALGVFGAGLVSKNKLQNKVTVVTATLSKSFGSYGGVIFSSEIICDYLISTSRQLIFNTAPPLGVIRAAREALSIIKNNPNLGEEVLRLSKFFSKKLEEVSGYSISNYTQIIPFIVRGNERLIKLSKRLEDEKILVHPMRSPTVKAGEERLRFSVTLNHSILELERAALLLSTAIKELQ